MGSKALQIHGTIEFLNSNVLQRLPSGTNLKWNSKVSVEEK